MHRAMALRGVRSVQASSRTVVRCSWALLFLLSISSGAAEHNKSEEALPLGTTWSAVPSGSEQDLLKWALGEECPAHPGQCYCSREYNRLMGSLAA